MKPGLLPPSTNVIDQTMSTSAQAPHAAPFGNKTINASKAAEQGAAQTSGLQIAHQLMTTLPAGNPFRAMLESMPVGAAQDHQLIQRMLKEGQNPKTPIPTPRPDPKEPHPTLFPYNNNKG